jgi:hypothetical protein
MKTEHSHERMGIIKSQEKNRQVITKQHTHKPLHNKTINWPESPNTSQY